MCVTYSNELRNDEEENIIEGRSSNNQTSGEEELRTNAGKIAAASEEYLLINANSEEPGLAWPHGSDCNTPCHWDTS